VSPALVPGGRLVSICMSPAVNIADAGYYHRHGFSVTSRGGEGDEVILTSVVPEMPFTLTAYNWSRATYEGALAEGGFKDVRWSAPAISTEGLEKLGRDYWQPYLDQPHAAIFTCSA
jgi:toxoflavin synthase